MKQLAVGIDIGGTNTAVGLVDLQGDIVAETSFPTRDYPDFDQYIEQIRITVGQLQKQPDYDHTLAGIGIGAPNANYFAGTIENAANLVWKGIMPVKEKVEKLFPGLKVVVTNDAKAAAVGEMVYGGARGMKDFILITLGTGLGSGFVAGGKVIYGHDSFAGELGHVVIQRSGRMCGCGRKGCLETYVSATGIKRTVFKLLADHMENSEFRALSFNDLTAEMITKAALREDPLAIEAFEYTGRMLGQALADAVAITSPEAIFLFGGLAKAGRYLFDPTRKYMEMNLLSNYRGKIKLLPSELEGRNAAILGASSLVWQG